MVRQPASLLPISIMLKFLHERTYIQNDIHGFIENIRPKSRNGAVLASEQIE